MPMTKDHASSVSGKQTYSWSYSLLSGIQDEGLASPRGPGREGTFSDMRPIELSGPQELVMVLREAKHPALLI